MRTVTAQINCKLGFWKVKEKNMCNIINEIYGGCSESRRGKGFLYSTDFMPRKIKNLVVILSIALSKCRPKVGGLALLPFCFVGFQGKLPEIVMALF